jgi:hypothetical protein
MLSFVLLISLFAGSLPAITASVACSPVQALSENCCSSNCPWKSETRAAASCCKISTDRSSARLLSSMPTPAVEPPTVTMVRLKSPLSVFSPLQSDWHRDLSPHLDPLALLCSRQI